MVPRATISAAVLTVLPMCTSVLSMCMLAVELSVFAGLLYRRILGPPVTVCVTVICRRLFLDSLVGKRLI